jgi:cell division septation protein DedD
VALQVGSFPARDGAARLLDELAGAGFPGFSAEGSGPFPVVRSGLSEPDARSLRDRLAAAGYESFLVRP